MRKEGKIEGRACRRPREARTVRIVMGGVRRFREIDRSWRVGVFGCSKEKAVYHQHIVVDLHRERIQLKLWARHRLWKEWDPKQILEEHHKRRIMWKRKWNQIWLRRTYSYLIDDLSPLCAEPLIPKPEVRRLRRVAWSMVSKAALRSRERHWKHWSS